MTSAVLGVLTASLLGSLHCAGMCGGLVALYATSDRSRGCRAWAAHAAYSGGRLLAYVSLGTLGGLAGAVLDRGGALAGVQRVAALAAGSLIVAWGLAILLKPRRAAASGGAGPAGPAPRRADQSSGSSAAPSRTGRASAPNLASRTGRASARRLAVRVWPSSPWGWRARVEGVVGRTLAAVAGMSAPARGLVVGLVTGLLPCGWLWAFVVVAVGTGRPSSGAVLMAAFWLGTLPMMLAVGIGLRALATPFRRYLPTASGLVMVSLGLLAILGRFLGHHHGAP